MWFQFKSSKSTKDIIFSAYSDAGSRPGVNQDGFYAKKRSDFAVFCVADGMGGHARGEVASGEIIKGVGEWTDSVPEPFEGDASALFDDFERIIEVANGIIYENYNQGTVCGSTVVALLMYEGKFCVVSVGDSRIYRMEEGVMTQITRDDVWQGIDSSPEFDANVGKLLKAVGVAEGLICNRFGGDLKKGDLFLLCSDGIYKYVGDEYLNTIPRMVGNAATSEELDNVMRAVQKQVVDVGAPDNNTGILIRIL